VIPKGHGSNIKRRGLEVFRAQLAEMVPFLANRVRELESFDDVKLLSVRIDRLERWQRPGLLCIGDAAHAMSPIGGVGSNLAIQDAVAAARLLAAPLLRGAVSQDALRGVQRRRQFPTVATQCMQVLLHDHVISPELDTLASKQPPLPLRLLRRFPRLGRVPAQMIGVGFQPEHVRG
jgi:2-polyprenyl-6-methoxyphenol hydroxylase-like FAD-dependent oxidoreductase